ncbi:MAG: hypothetical protein ACLFV7_00465 [Phycisphaerae bacterium]
MKRTILVLLVALPASSVLAQMVKPKLSEPATQPAAETVATRPATRPETGNGVSAASRMVGQSFLTDAAGIMQLPDAQHRGGRALALALAASELDPHNDQTYRMLADFLEVMGARVEAAKASEQYLAANRQDHAAGLRWLDRTMVLLQGAQARNSFFEKVAEAEAYPKPLRAEARARQGLLLSRQGMRQAAMLAIEQALALDPHNPRALGEYAQITGDRTATASAKLNVKLLRGNPSSAQAAWELAGLLGSEGLYRRALAFYDYGWGISERKTRSAKAPNQYVLYYCGAMLDANAPKQVIETFQPRLDDWQTAYMVKNIRESWDLRTLMIEAYRDAGQDANAQALVDELSAMYQKKKDDAERSTQLAREAAKFYVVTARDYSKAADFIDMIQKVDPDNPDTQAMIGAVEIGTGREEDGEKRLRKYMLSSVWACAFLADYYYTEGKLKEGKTVLEAAVNIQRNGWAFRHLRDIARKHDATIPQNPARSELADAVDDVIEDRLPLWSQPGKLLVVDVSAVRKEVHPGEPIEVKVTIRNIGDIALPVGNWGLFSSAVALQAKVSGADGNAVTFNNFPVVSLPSPRYLEAGKAISHTARIDLGPLRRYLAARPMETLSLSVDAVLDFVVVEKEDQTTLYSPLPSVVVNTARVTRNDLWSLYPAAKRNDPKDSFLYLVAYLVKDMRKGEPAARMRAARIAGGLMSYAERIAARKASAPQGVTQTMVRGYPLSMMREMLDPKRQPMFAVRAEMVASLRYVELDQTGKKILESAFNDPSPYVRMRVAERVGQDGEVSFRRRVRKFADDKSFLVKQMVSAFGVAVSNE